MKVRLAWQHGGKEVYVKFYNWDLLIKLAKNSHDTFEASVCLPIGTYYYNYIVDGKPRFAPG